MFEDEKTTCGTAACSFFVFTALYIVVLSLQVSSRSVDWLYSCSCQALTARVCAQFDTTNSYAVTKVRSASPTAAPVHSSATARAD